MKEFKSHEATVTLGVTPAVPFEVMMNAVSILGQLQAVPVRALANIALKLPAFGIEDPDSFLGQFEKAETAMPAAPEKKAEEKPAAKEQPEKSAQGTGQGAEPENEPAQEDGGNGLLTQREPHDIAPTRAESVALLEAAARVLAMEGDGEEFEEGGPGSGNWGHAGVKGVHGGSAPSKGGPGSVMSMGDTARTARARWEAARGHAGAKGEGPQVFFDYETAPAPSVAVAAKTLPAGDKTLKQTDANDIRGKQIDIRSGIAAAMARGAYNSIRSGDAKGLTLDNERGHAEAIMAYKSDDDLRPGKYLYVDYLASGVKGGGTRLMAEACRLAASQGRGVSLSAIKTAQSFYEKLGMKRIRDGQGHYSDTRDFAFTRKSAEAFANQVLGAA